MEDKTFCFECNKEINTKDSCLNDDIDFEYRCVDCYINRLEDIITKMEGVNK